MADSYAIADIFLQEYELPTTERHHPIVIAGYLTSRLSSTVDPHGEYTRLQCQSALLLHSST